MTIYISGKITGTTDYLNRFKEAEQHLKKAGHEVVNPAELNQQFGTNRPWEFYMRNCIRWLIGCKAIYMLKGWQDSKGASFEREVAINTGITVIEQEDDLDEWG